MQIQSVGIDLGKTTFHLVALGAAGKLLVKKKFTQKQLLAYTANLQTSLIGLEACAGAHFLGRALRQQGHDVRLIPAQFVKPFVKSNKNDFVSSGIGSGSTTASLTLEASRWTSLRLFGSSRSRKRRRLQEECGTCQSLERRPAQANVATRHRQERRGFTLIVASSRVSCRNFIASHQPSL